MKNFFCFVTSDSNKTAYDILLKRIKDKQWVTYEKTQHTLLKKEDEIIFYIAGKNIYKQSFLGRAQIENVEKPHEAIIDPDNPKKEVFMVVMLKKIIIFKNPILVKEIINNLDKTGIKEVCAHDTTSLLEISNIVWDNPSIKS